MEIVGGFMVMVCIIGLFLAVVWLIMPFVVFAIKGKQDRTLEVLEAIEKRLEALETHLQPVEPERHHADSSGSSSTSAESSNESPYAHHIENEAIPPEPAAGKNGPDVSPAV